MTLWKKIHDLTSFEHSFKLILYIEGFVQMQKIIRNFASISLESCVCVNRNIENTATVKEKQESKCKKNWKLCIAETAQT